MAKRIFLEKTSQNDLGAILDKLRRERVKAVGGASIGADAIVLAEPADIDRAIQLLKQLGLKAEVG
jgi:UDP-N-acetylglucosamine enolpyruvyl transferase